MHWSKSWAVLPVSAISACGSSTPPPVDSGAAPPDSAVVADSGTVAVDAAPDGAACTPVAPTSNFCSMEGCNFRDATFPSCAPGVDTYNFYNSDFCHARVTLVVFAAGWCVPCQMEAPMIEQLIAEGTDPSGTPYADLGVRVISIYGQNRDASAPTPNECTAWRDRYHQTAPNMHSVYDPMGISSVYFPNQAFPSNMLIDGHGVIRYRAYGTSAGLQDLRDQIDGLLADPTNQ